MPKLNWHKAISPPNVRCKTTTHEGDQMGRIVYVHGQFVPEEEARIGLFDRGFLFGDAVYEVTAVIAGRMIDNDLHLERLARSPHEFFQSFKKLLH